jgi:hypothetical protein
MSRRPAPPSFVRHFEGRAALDELLSMAGAKVDTEGAAALFAQAVEEEASAAETIPLLFDGEPTFEHPELARRLYQNLLGLFDAVEQGGPLRLDSPPPKERKLKPAPPAPFAPGEPDQAFVEAAWRYLEDAQQGDLKALERLTHAFENRQDALLQHLEEQGLSEAGYAHARYLLFELFAMLELGWPQGVAPIALADLRGSEAVELPRALWAYAEEALFEAEQDEELLLGEELATVRAQVRRGLYALWRARRGAEG